MKKTFLLLSIIGLLSFNTQQPKTVTVTFTVDELQVVYDALGELPAKKVEVIRAKIIYEASRQLDTTKKK
jgi:VanZ family protein